MRTLRFIGAIGIIVLLFTSIGYAQSRFQAGGDFTLGFPLGDFKYNVDRLGLGFSGHFLYNLRKSPISVGISLGYLMYGSETRVEPFSLTIPEVTVNVTTRNNILMCHFLLRVQPLDGEIQPYFDGLFGFNYLWTETGIYNRGWHDEIASNVIFDDSTSSYGVGGGLMIKVFAPKSESSKNNYALYIDMGARYLKGGEAEYLREGSIYQENGDLVYEVNFSSTDLITANIGLTFTF
jgi:hypothetical protein